MDSSSILRNHGQAAILLDVSELLDSYLTNKRNCRHIFIPGFTERCCVQLCEADANHALIGMITTLPKVLLGLLKNTATATLRCSSSSIVLELCQQGTSVLPNLCADHNG